MQIESNLAVCPNELVSLDSNAIILWPSFLKRVGLHLNRSGEVIENDGHRADIVRRFAVQSLIQRLPRAKDERSRARVWWRESIACSDGESDLPELTPEKLYVTNSFIVTAELKYPDPRTARLRKSNMTVIREIVGRGRPRKTDEEKRASEAARKRRLRAQKRLSFQRFAA